MLPHINAAQPANEESEWNGSNQVADENDRDDVGHERLVWNVIKIFIAR